MAQYVEGFITPVPKKNLKKYTAFAKKIGRMFKKYGAITYIECEADDAPMGKITSFPQSVKMKSNETVFFSYITFKSRSHRDKVMKKAMKDPLMGGEQNEMHEIFDGKRMIYGGFKTVVKM